jgi:hypothetical protein
VASQDIYRAATYHGRYHACNRGIAYSCP